MFGKRKDNLTESDRVPSPVQQLQRSPVAALEAPKSGRDFLNQFKHHDRRQN